MKMVNGKKTRMNEQKFYAVKQSLDVGKKPNDIAQFFDVHYSTVCRIKKFETWEGYQEYIRESAEAARKRAEAAKAAEETKLAEVTVEDEVETPTDTTVVVPAEETNLPITKLDLMAMEARLNENIRKQVAGLRIYLSGPQKSRLVKEVTASVAGLFDSSSEQE